MALPHLCLVNSLRTWGGAEVWFLETALSLQDRGHRITIIAQPDSELARRCQAEGVPCFTLGIRFDAAPWTLVALIRFFRSQHVSAVVTNLTKDLKACAVAGRLARVPIILASRESDFPLKNKIYYPWYFRDLATGLLVNSEATRRTIQDSAPWLPQSSVHLLYKGIDVQRFHPAQEPVDDVVGFAGQLIERKGLATLMQAWTLMQEQEPPPSARRRLLIAGQGPLEPELRQWRSQLKDPESVQLLGLVENMPAFFRQISLLAMPSISEGFGLVAAEALACGIPVVATDTSSLPEIIHHEKNGLLIAVDHVPALASALGHLLDNPEKARQLGLAGRAHVVQNFNRRQTLSQLETLTGLNSRGQ